MDTESTIRLGQELAQAMDPNCDFEARYTFYYDETNNIRKYHNKTGTLNYSGDSNFVLGGIVFTAPPQLSDFFASLNLDKNIAEVKFKHIAKGDYFTCLKSPKLSKLLSFLIGADFFIHYHSINLFYWALVDIVDSAIVGSGRLYEPNDILALKDIFHRAATHRKEKMLETFYYFSYPNVPNNELKNFSYHICKHLKAYKQHKAGVEEMIRILTEASACGDLPFIVHETDNVFIDSFSPFYRHPVFMFRSSEHYFDHELEIEEDFQQVPLMFGSENLYSNCQFVGSENNLTVQLSDIVVGLMGKLYEYINTTELKNVQNEFKVLNEHQQNNYRLVAKIINRSIDENSAFVLNTISNEQREIWRKILSYS